MTDAFPFNERDLLDDVRLRGNNVFDSEARVLAAPELDDMLDTDNLPVLRLAPPSGHRDDARGGRRVPAGRPAGPPARHGKHRGQPVSAVRGRVLMAAMAAGAAAAAAHQVTHSPNGISAQTVSSAGDSVVASGPGVPVSHGMQVVTVKQAANVVLHDEELAKGVAFAQERAEREARLQRPLFVMPTRGQFTSNFGYRWGVLHAGIDIANSIGTPILAASDGVVIEAGPSSGYGMLVKLRHYDGTVTLYGHVNSTTVSVGERVMAGDQIATMGNRGYSTGSHLHFEVLVGGINRVDPVSWLAKRGITLA
ncbi:MAG TPA: M23 family metallopeptidase [Mycobacterium sp.]